MRANVIVNSYGGEADVREVRVDAAEVLGVHLDVEISGLSLVFHAPTILRRWSKLPARRIAYGVNRGGRRAGGGHFPCGPT